LHLRRRGALEAELERQDITEEEKRRIIAELEKLESDYTRLQRQRMSADDFEPLTIIGRGAFGEVRWLPPGAAQPVGLRERPPQAAAARAGQAPDARGAPWRPPPWRPAG
jgi:serine/threonine kinase 38